MTFRERRLRVVGVGGTLREGSASLGALRRALAAARRDPSHAENGGDAACVPAEGP